MEWVKLYTSLPHDPDFRRMSVPARMAFPLLCAYAGELELGGALRVRSGALTAAEIATYLAVPVDVCEAILSELSAPQFGFILLDLTGTYVIRNFEFWQRSKDPTAADRQARYRDRKRAGLSDAVTVTPTLHRDVTAGLPSLDVDLDVDKDRIKGSRSLNAPPTVDFGHLEDEISAYLGAMAQENKSGRITEGRIKYERAKLKTVLDEIGPEAFERGLHLAVKAGVGNANYVKKAGTSKPRATTLPFHDRNKKPGRSSNTGDHYAELA